MTECLSNAVLSLQEVLSLSLGLKVWVESRYDARFTGEYFRAKKDGDNDVLRSVENPDNGCWLQPGRFGLYFRTWLRCPTDEERNNAHWEEQINPDL